MKDILTDYISTIIIMQYSRSGMQVFVITLEHPVLVDFNAI